MSCGQRKGARTLNDIPADILKELNEGTIESVNLTEWLAVDHILLTKVVLPAPYADDCANRISQLKNKSTMQMIQAVGEVISNRIKEEQNTSLFGQLSKHHSDSVRCWAAYIVGGNPSISIDKKLEAIRPFAADHQFGVREIAWMAVRPTIDEHIETAIAILSTWAKDDEANVRRFATESIRPKGVWCKQLERMKQEPELALPILETLKSDESKYVQDSVANWLNDASKSTPDFVLNLCQKWGKESKTKSTQYIINRALRTINKK